MKKEKTSEISYQASDNFIRLFLSHAKGENESFFQQWEIHEVEWLSG